MSAQNSPVFCTYGNLYQPRDLPELEELFQARM